MYPAQKTAWWVRIGFVAISIALYIESYFILEPTVGPAIVALSLIPAAAAGWMFGFVSGLIAGLASFPLNVLLLTFTGKDGMEVMVPGGIAGTLAVVALGGLVGRLKDTSGKLQKELAEYARLENMYKTLVEASPDVITMIRLDGVITYASNQNLKIYGYKPEDLMGQSAFSFFAPEDIENVKKDVADLTRGVNRGLTEYSIIRKDGSLAPVEMSSSIIKDDQGSPSYIVTFIRNIEGRKKVEEQLIKQKEELERTTKLMIGRELKMAEIKKRIKGSTPAGP